MDARETAERFRPVTGDVGIYDPAAPTDDTVLADKSVRVGV